MLFYLNIRIEPWQVQGSKIFAYLFISLTFRIHDSGPLWFISSSSLRGQGLRPAGESIAPVHTPGPLWRTWGWKLQRFINEPWWKSKVCGGVALQLLPTLTLSIEFLGRRIFWGRGGCWIFPKKFWKPSVSWFKLCHSFSVFQNELDHTSVHWSQR